MQNSNKKVCLVVSSLGKGGAERSTALVSIMLNNLGYDVHIITILDFIEYEYKGELLNLGELEKGNNSFTTRIKKLKVFKNYIKKHSFDVIIDSRSKPQVLKEFLIQKFLYKNQNVINVIHSYNIANYLPEQKWIYNLLFDTSIIHVAVSNKINETLKSKYKLSKVVTIYNAVNSNENIKSATEKIEINYEYILFYGRLMDRVKNIRLLINAYNKSQLKSENIKLIILGSGEDKMLLEKEVSQLNLEDFVVFIPHKNNPFPYIKKAKFIVLTSRYEGFPMVLPEALSVSTPVISVDCESGPKEIIKHKHNGLLIENHSVNALAEALNSFIFDSELYTTCKNNAKESIEAFSIESISRKWQTLIESINIDEYRKG